MSADQPNSKADTLVKVVLVFFIALLSFSVGTFVGKQVSDSDHRRMALEGEYKADRQVASIDEKADGESSEKITEKEVESLTEEFVNKEKREPASTEEHGEHAEHREASEQAAASEHAAPAAHDQHAEAASGHGEKAVEHKDGKGFKPYARVKPEAQKVGGHDKADKHEAPAKVEEKHEATAEHGAHAATESKAKPAAKAAADATHKVAEKVAKGHAPSDGKKEEASKAQSALPTVAKSAVGKFAVQVASYVDEKEAKTHAADLKGKGYEAFYISASVKGQTWYRVLVGLFDSAKNADEYRGQLMKETGTKSAVVQKIVQ